MTGFSKKKKKQKRDALALLTPSLFHSSTRGLSDITPAGSSRKFKVSTSFSEDTSQDELFSSVGSRVGEKH